MYYMHVLMRARVCVCVYMYVRMYEYMYVRMYVCVYVSVHMISQALACVRVT